MASCAFSPQLFQTGLVGVIFDCDGVMIDSESANRYLYNAILDNLKLPHLTFEQERFAFQATFRDAIETLVPRKLHPKMEDAIRTSVDYDADILPKIKLMPGYRQFIEKCHQKDIKLAIDTNRTEAGILKIIEYFDLPHWFAPIISASVAPPKPSPAGAMHILNEWGANPGQVLFVGDSADDRKAAEGADVVFASFGPYGPGGRIQAASWDCLAEILWKE